MSEDSSENLFAKQYYLQDFPYNSFSSLLGGSDSPQTKYPKNWEFLLLIAFLNSFSEDPDSLSGGQYDHLVVKKNFEDIGILPNKTFTEIITKTQEREFKVNLRLISWKKRTTDEEKKINQLKSALEILKDVCYHMDASKQHLIIIDGLDDVLSKRKEREFQTISSLIISADRMNNKFKENCVNAKVVVLCREDLINAINDPNINKIYQDSTIYLKWFNERINIEESNLVKLINKRANLSFDTEGVDVFKDFFPPQIGKSGKDAIKVIFNYTRHTPRDLIQLMNKIQKSTNNENPTPSEIWTGVNIYSNEYFVNEVKNELKGFLEDNEINKLIELLHTIGKSPFSLQELESLIEDDPELKSLDLRKIFSRLYECNAIGNFNSKTNRTYFKYRSPHSSFSPSLHVFIHNGLQDALSIKNIDRDEISKIVDFESTRKYL